MRKCPRRSGALFPPAAEEGENCTSSAPVLHPVYIRFNEDGLTRKPWLLHHNEARCGVEACLQAS
jgi:hypothetical protein